MPIDYKNAGSKEPLYLRLTEDVLEQINSGTLKPGDRLPSISELRKKHGLCKQTIERAHQLLEQRGVVVRRQGIGTFVTEQVTESRSSHGVIGFAGLYSILDQQAHNYSRIYAGQVLEGIHEVVGSRDIQVMLFDPEDTKIYEKADGVLFNGSYARPQQRWRDEKLPCVALIDPSQYLDLSSVSADRHMASCLATQHLIDLGHRKIAYLNNVNDEAGCHFTGYKKTMAQAGIELQPSWVRHFAGPMMNFYRVGLRNMREWVDDGWADLGCSALVAPNEETALAVVDTLTDSGWKVPEDFSVVGMDDNEPGSNLTTAALPLKEVGRRGAELLLHQIEHGVKSFEHIALPATMVVRGTTAPPRTELTK